MQCSVMLHLTHVEQKWGSRLPPQEAPIVIAEKHKLFFSFLSGQKWAWPAVLAYSQTLYMHETNAEWGAWSCLPEGSNLQLSTRSMCPAKLVLF